MSATATDSCVCDDVMTPVAPLTIVALLEARGHLQLYRRDTVNHCPACGHSQWVIGRAVAQCALCEAAIPLMHPMAPSLDTDIPQAA